MPREGRLWGRGAGYSFDASGRGVRAGGVPGRCSAAPRRTGGAGLRLFVHASRSFEAGRRLKKRWGFGRGGQTRGVGLVIIMCVVYFGLWTQGVLQPWIFTAPGVAGDLVGLHPRGAAKSLSETCAQAAAPASFPPPPTRSASSLSLLLLQRAACAAHHPKSRAFWLGGASEGRRAQGQ